MPPATAPASPTAADLARSITLENTTRNVFLFQFVELSGPAKKQVVKRHLRIGDAADREPYIPGQRDENLQPNPIVDVTGAMFQAIGPEACRVMLGYIDNGTLRVTRGEAAFIRQFAGE